MSNLKSFLWKQKTSVSTKSKKYHNQLLRLKQWPDFGFVGCPEDYITISSFLIRKPLTFKQIKQLTDAADEDLNHYIYVCRMLQIMEITENSGVQDKPIRMFADAFTSRLRSLFFSSMKYD